LQDIRYGMTQTTGTSGRPGLAAATPWLPYQRQPQPAASLRLFCLPYAGGSALIYRSWPSTLPPGVEVCPVQLPGRGHRMNEPPFLSGDALVPALAEALSPYLDKPFAIFGHSMGAHISFELARHLRRHAGLAPEHLFVSGRRAPQLPERGRIVYDLPDDELVEHLRHLNGTPREVLESPELMQLMLPLLRADFALCDTYAYADEPPLDCPVTAFGGLGDTDVPRVDVEAWAAQTTGAFSLRMLPGDHFFIHEQEASILHVLARELQQIVLRLSRRG
jgi:medium-chain acyl-[acyl-carrier-protein] hydrolase